MTYIGEVQHGIVVLKDAPPLPDGTLVRVEAEPIDEDRVDSYSADKKPVEKRPRRGSPEAVLQSMGKLSRSWSESSAEMGDALEYLHQTKWEEVRNQQAKPEINL